MAALPKPSEDVWPEPTHGAGRALPWRAAAAVIDWSLPCPSIFERSKPLAEATLRRIARGIRRYVLDAAEPSIVRGVPGVSPYAGPMTSPESYQYDPARGWVVPSLIQTSYGEREGQAPRVLDLHKPLGTVVADGQKHALGPLYRMAPCDPCRGVGA